jgi:hypothetical protein
MKLPPRTTADRFLDVTLLGSDCYLYPTPKCTTPFCVPGAPSANQKLINCKSANTLLNSLRILTSLVSDAGNYVITVSAGLNYPAKYAFISPDIIKF